MSFDSVIFFLPDDVESKIDCISFSLDCSHICFPALLTERSRFSFFACLVHILYICSTTCMCCVYQLSLHVLSISTASLVLITITSS